MVGATASWCGKPAITWHFTGEIHTLKIVFFRSLFGSIFLIPWLLGAGLKGLKTKRVGLHLTLCLTSLAIIYLLFFAILSNPIGK